MQEQELEKRIREAYLRYGAPSTHEARRSSVAPEYNPNQRVHEMHTIKIEPAVIGPNHKDYSANCAYSISWDVEDSEVFGKQLSHIRNSIKTTFNSDKPSYSATQRANRVNLIKSIIAVELKCGLRIPVVLPSYPQQAVRDHVNSYGCSVKPTDFIFDCPALASGSALHIPLQDIKAVVIVCASSMRSYRRLRKSKETVQKLFGAPQGFDELKDQI